METSSPQPTTTGSNSNSNNAPRKKRDSHQDLKFDQLGELLNDDLPDHRSSAFALPSTKGPEGKAHNRYDGHRVRIRDLTHAAPHDYEAQHGKWTHLKHKEVRYRQEERTRQHDPYSHIDVASRGETFFYGQATRGYATESEHFAYIVDLDNYEYHKVVFHSFLAEILQSSFFRYGILLLVLVNAVLIGVQTISESESTEDNKIPPLLLEILDSLILSVFIFEIIIKWIYDFRLFWSTIWNILDFVIAVLTLAAALIPKTSGTLARVSQILDLSVKVVRAFRSLRVVSTFRSLRVVTLTVIKSALDLGSILLVLLIVMVVLSVTAVTLFDDRDISPQRFLDVLDSWFIVFICVTQDGWASILNEFLLKNAENKATLIVICIFLMVCVSLGAFVFANLIVAVIVSNLELSVRSLRSESKLEENPLDLNSQNEEDVQTIPMYELLSKNNFIFSAQRPIHVPRVKKITNRNMQIYLSLIVALEQNLLEAEIITVDFEKIMAVLLSIVSQLDVASGKIAEKERKAALDLLQKMNEKKPGRASSLSNKSRQSKHSVSIRPDNARVSSKSERISFLGQQPEEEEANKNNKKRDSRVQFAKSEKQ